MVSTLSLEEWACLREAAHGRPLSQWPTAILARLEQLGLLMRGWGSAYVLTAAGEAALQLPPSIRRAG